MTREERLERNVKYLLWVLMILNMVGVLLLRHPDALRAQVGPSTNFAGTVAPSAGLAPAA